MQINLMNYNMQSTVLYTLENTKNKVYNTNKFKSSFWPIKN